MEKQKLVLYMRHEHTNAEGKIESIISEVNEKFETEQEAIAWARSNVKNTDTMKYYYRIQPWTLVE